MDHKQAINEEIDRVRAWFEGHPESAVIEELAARSVKFQAELAQLRARVAILDAQEGELPELGIRRVDFPTDSVFFQRLLKAREPQLLDALRAAQAWREVATGLRYEVTLWNKMCATYDTLAGKEGE